MDRNKKNNNPRRDEEVEVIDLLTEVKGGQSKNKYGPTQLS